MSLLDTVTEHLGKHASSIISAAEKVGLELPLACALVEQESGGRNIFGCDHGSTGDRPPYCHHEVTKERIAALRDDGYYTHGMNGVGLCQLTWWTFVEEAEALGGAHTPYTQCLVGFRLLKDYVERYPYMQALAAYNAGEDNWQAGSGYAGELAAKHEKWKALLAPPAPESNFSPDADRWLKNAEGQWARAKDYPNTKLQTNKDGWLWLPEPKKVEPSPWNWPVANTPVGRIGDGSYIDLHPTRYNWRVDIEAWARYLVDNYDVWCNTYVDHPPGWRRDATSIDVWGSQGRGYSVGYAVGQQVFDLLFNYPDPPQIDWVIWNKRMWTRAGGWVSAPAGPADSDPWHYSHIHITYV